MLPKINQKASITGIGTADGTIINLTDQISKNQKNNLQQIKGTMFDCYRQMFEEISAPGLSKNLAKIRKMVVEK